MQGFIANIESLTRGKIFIKNIRVAILPLYRPDLQMEIEKLYSMLSGEKKTWKKVVNIDHYDENGNFQLTLEKFLFENCLNSRKLN